MSEFITHKKKRTLQDKSKYLSQYWKVIENSQKKTRAGGENVKEKWTSGNCSPEGPIYKFSGYLMRPGD